MKLFDQQTIQGQGKSLDRKDRQIAAYKGLYRKAIKRNKELCNLIVEMSHNTSYRTEDLTKLVKLCE
jgi:hypothetical protein